MRIGIHDRVEVVKKKKKDRPAVGVQPVGWR